MARNHLKLNKNKTKVIELLPASHNVNARLITDLFVDSSRALTSPTSFVKNLGLFLMLNLIWKKMRLR